MRRIRDCLTHVRDAAGKWVPLVLAEPPLHRSAGGTDRSLRKQHNDALGIYKHRPIHAPAPVADDHAMRAASRALLGGRTIDVAIPSKDGYSGAAWALNDVCSDLWQATAGNLRPLLPPPGSGSAA